jgi:DNA repair exonuclease SbcCD nuclease subunit
MNFIAFADLHFHEHPVFTEVQRDGENIFVSIALDCVKQIFDYAEKNEVGQVYHLGDLFHVRNRLPVKLINKLMRVFSTIPEHVRLFLLRGTPAHDGEGENFNGNLFDRIPWIDSVSSGRPIIVMPGINGPTIVYGVPSMPREQMLESIRKFADEKWKGMKILLMHGAIEGAKVVDYESKDSEAILHKDLKGFDFVFSGHYHANQQVAKNVWYVGSPYRISFAERDDEKVFLHFKDGEVKFVPLEVPGMVQYEFESMNLLGKPDVEGCFVKVVVKGPESYLKAYDYEKKKTFFLGHGALGVRFERELVEDEKVVREVRIRKEDDPERMLDRYFDFMKEEGQIGDLDLETLKTFGLEAMRGVKKA